MTLKRLQNFLRTLLRSCHKSGTSAHEEGIKVSMDRRQGEIIDVFHIDCTEGRRCLNMEGQGQRISDYLYYYTVTNEKYEIACAVELKGGKLQHASDQVKKTHKRLVDLLTQEIPGQSQENAFIWKICIC